MSNINDFINFLNDFIEGTKNDAEILGIDLEEHEYDIEGAASDLAEEFENVDDLMDEFDLVSSKLDEYIIR